MHDGTLRAHGQSLRFTETGTVDADIVSFWNEFAADGATVLCHTSGSTGLPKPLRVEKSAMRYSARQTVRFFGLDASHTALLCLPAKYIAGRMMLVRAHVADMRVHVVSPSLNPLKNNDIPPIDFAAFTPAQVLEILKDDESTERLARIKHVIIGGAAIDPELEKRLLALPNNLYATYGMTETVSHIALRKLGEKPYVKISPDTLLETDAEDCLSIFDPNLTREPLQTNDVVDLLDDSRFVWLGRRDFVINSGGLKLHPEQLEEKIRTLPRWAGAHFFVAATPDERFGQRPILITENDAPTDMEGLETVLDKWEMPQKILRVSAFVWTESGKLNRTETLLRMQ